MMVEEVVSSPGKKKRPLVEVETTKCENWPPLMLLANVACKMAVEDEKPKKNNRPYKRLKSSTTSPVMMGWLKKYVHWRGLRLRLLVEKKLSSTDLSDHHGRLLPTKAGADLLQEELSDAEKEAVKGERGLAVTMLDRWGREYHGAVLAYWKSKEWYVIRGARSGWLRLSGDNHLRDRDVVRIFCFRAERGLVIVVSDDKEVVAGKQQSTTTTTTSASTHGQR